jgi:hypothetical protein
MVSSAFPGSSHITKLPNPSNPNVADSSKSNQKIKQPEDHDYDHQDIDDLQNRGRDNPAKLSVDKPQKNTDDDKNNN